jgi:hypothetical protein
MNAQDQSLRVLQQPVFDLSRQPSSSAHST